MTSTMTTRTTEGIAAAKHILEKRVTLPALRAAVVAAQKEMAEAAGYKKTIARQKLEAEEGALAKCEAAIRDEEAAAPDTVSLEGRLIWRLAEYQLKRESLLKALEHARDDVLLAEEQSEKNAWKRVGSGPTLPMRKAQEAFDAAEKALKALDSQEEYQRAVTWCAEEVRFEQRQAALQAWRETGVAPDFVLARRAAEEAAYWSSPDVVVLKLGKKNN